MLSNTFSTLKHRWTSRSTKMGPYRHQLARHSILSRNKNSDLKSTGTKTFEKLGDHLGSQRIFFSLALTQSKMKIFSRRSLTKNRQAEAVNRSL
jgi:hypothetical protein